MNWLLVIPQLLVLYALNVVLGVLWIVAWFSILFTARIPEGMFAFMATIFRYQWRVLTFWVWMRESYPPFDLTAAGQDPGTDPARLSVKYPGELSRLLIFVKWLLVIPHLIVLFFLYIGAYIAAIIGFFAVLITGRWPEGLRRYIVGVARWGYRVEIYYYLMTDAYPPFSLA
ncbi:MAG: DUF4389 domain-containing protein [Acidimicrobiales bacterium]